MAINELENTGLDNHVGNTAGRLFNKQGQPNVIKSGLPWYKRYSSFHTLINMNIGKYILSIFVAYSILNFLFASIYYALGTKAISVADAHVSNFKFFQNCFFFSAQTLTTVGYGRISPISLSANIVSSLEGLIGLLLFAVITGLSYARFAKPRSHIKFSSKLLIAPFQDGKALMFRLVSRKNNILTDAHAKVTAAVAINKNGKIVNEFFNLNLEIEKINTLSFNWTIVHPLDAESPFADFIFEDFINKNVEIIVFISAYDEQYNNKVLARTSYTANEFVNNAKFKLMFFKASDSTHTVLELQKLNDYELVG